MVELMVVSMVDLKVVWTDVMMVDLKVVQKVVMMAGK